ncbi:hypothetical protein AAE026_31245 [Bradyrhizobium sp. DN5]|uniref:hypothetical protein n=1 Tax=Bradyrhizobium sp. DN5 TaxID=3056950 RepID=UPI0035234E44
MPLSGSLIGLPIGYRKKGIAGHQSLAGVEGQQIIEIARAVGQRPANHRLIVAIGQWHGNQIVALTDQKRLTSAGR